MAHLSHVWCECVVHMSHHCVLLWPRPGHHYGMGEQRFEKSSALHHEFCRRYHEQWQVAGGTLLAFSEVCAVPRETLRGWLAKDRIELLENLQAAFAALGCEIQVKARRRPVVPPIDRRRTTQA